MSIIGINQFTIQLPKIDNLLGKTIIHEDLFICRNYYIFTQTICTDLTKCVSLALKKNSTKSLVSAFISSVSPAASTAPHRESSRKKAIWEYNKEHISSTKR